jgi:hypothetical protein
MLRPGATPASDSTRARFRNSFLPADKTPNPFRVVRRLAAKVHTQAEQFYNAWVIHSLSILDARRHIRQAIGTEPCPFTYLE